MTSKELLDLLLNDWLEGYKKYKQNGYSNYPVFEDSYSVFYVNKNYSTIERSIIFKEMVLEFLIKMKVERDIFFNEYKNTPLTEEQYNQMIDKNYEIGRCFEHLSKFGILQNDGEIIEFLSFFKNPFSLEVIEAGTIKLHNINSSFIHIGHILDIVSLYKSEKKGLSSEIIQQLENFKEIKEVKESEYYQTKITELLKPFDVSSIFYDEYVEKKSITLNSLTTDKKWKWLQEHPLNFIDNRDEFYELIASLSKINFFDKFQISDKSSSTIKKIKPNDFEAFILDIHSQTNEEVGKRSNWFVGDKVLVYQIFVWILFEIKTPNLYPILTKLAEKCFTKIPNVGPISRKLGDVVLKLLYESQTIEGLGTLLKLKSRNKYPVFLDELNNSIARAVRYSNLNPNDVEDYFISDYGIADGVLEKGFGDYKSTLKINSFDEIEVAWTKLDTKLKSEPSAVKTNFKNELKVWKSTISDVKKEFSGQKLRIESFWTKKKSWDYEVWKKYFFDHQILCFITRKLIWQIENNGHFINVYYHNGHFVDSQKNTINIENTKLTLWHPALSSVEEVQRWRNFMIDNEIKQPFKQAFREVYIVTDAEINTATFSNRFNNHIIRHHKFIALAQQRLWKYSHSDLYSGGEKPSKIYPDFNIKCIFDLDSEYDFATTQQIHFRDTENNVALKMNEIPMLIFSETMRDADLFVGVCSIGAEEQWETQIFRAYWTGYSAADLSETAQTRKSVIQSIISKLNIKDKCEVTDKYLKVTGSLRVYKIHFGSGNILMEPNDEYLCIIPDTNATIKDKLFLPFDGDPTLSIIISKAILLANDEKITDSVILNQINRK